MSTGSQRAAVTPFLLEKSGGCILIDGGEECSIHIYFHFAEDRTSLIDNAKLLPCKAKGHIGTDNLCYLEFTAVGSCI